MYAVTKGISANMLKMSSKRRRTLKQIREEKLAKEQEAAATEEKLQQFEQMQQQLQLLQQESENGKMATSLMSQFISAGLVKQTDEDEFVVNSSPGESKFKAFADHC